MQSVCLIRRIDVVPRSWVEIMMERREVGAEPPAYGGWKGWGGVECGCQEGRGMGV